MLSNEDFELIASVKPGTSLTKISRMVELAAVETSTGVAKAQNQFNDELIEKLQEEVERYRAATDSGVEGFIAEAVSRITDYTSSQAFIETATVDWFRVLIMSEEAKCKLAEALIKACYPFVKKSVPTLWSKLALRDLDTMDQVRFSVEDVKG